MLQQMLEKWRLVAEALAGMDDPQGELETRIRRLEGEVERLSGRVGDGSCSLGADDGCR
jgi:hypothetical protein